MAMNKLICWIILIISLIYLSAGCGRPCSWLYCNMNADDYDANTFCGGGSMLSVH